MHKELDADVVVAQVGERVLPSEKRGVVQPLPWSSRISAMPSLPGGGANQLNTLRMILGQIEAVEGLLTALISEESGQDRTLKDALKPIPVSSGFFYYLDRTHVALSDPARVWLSSKENLDLLTIFHRHIRFTGEALAQFIEGPITLRDLVQTASDEYEMGWTTLDQGRRRVTWLICLGALQYRTATNIEITEAGRQMVASLALDRPDTVDADLSVDVEVPASPAGIQTLVSSLTPESLAVRNPILGYIPRGNGVADAVSALSAIVDSASPSIGRSELFSFIESRFGVSESSIGAVMTTLTKSNLIEQTALNVFAPTDLSREWLEAGSSAVDLVLMLHSRYSFILEIVTLLSEYDRAPEIAKAAVDFYGMPRHDVAGVRTRLQLLQTAGLIEERGSWRFQTTALGRTLADRVLLQVPDDPSGSVDGVRANTGLPTKQLAVADQLGRELVEASTDSDNSVRLEQAVAHALEFLGFRSRHIGGAGKTDVLASVDDEQLKPIRIALDAKSARSGNVAESAVSFDTLREHQEKSSADYLAVVGPGFELGRIKARAKQNHVALLTAAELAQAVKLHATTPLSAFSYVDLFRPEGAGTERLESRRLRRASHIDLLATVVSVLADEARDMDTVTNGALTSDQIYLIAREGTAGAKPSPRDIESVLALLEHPLLESVRSVSSDRGRAPAHYLIDDPNLVRSKLLALATVLVELDGATATEV